MESNIHYLTDASLLDTWLRRHAEAGTKISRVRAAPLPPPQIKKLYLDITLQQQQAAKQQQVRLVSHAERGKGSWPSPRLLPGNFASNLELSPWRGTSAFCRDAAVADRPRANRRARRFRPASGCSACSSRTRS
jgi:hypothetical protein